MVQRAEREPSMEEIVVALRETTRSADRMLPFVVGGPTRGNRASRTMGGSADLTDLRDGEIERLLAENARLNARVIALLKVLEQEQAYHAAAATETEAVSREADGAAIHREVRAALESELRPALLVLLRLLQKRSAGPSPDDRDAERKARLAAATVAVPSDWIVDLMHKLDDKAPVPNDTVAAEYHTPRRSKLRQYAVDVLNAFGLEPHAATPRQRFARSEQT